MRIPSVNFRGALLTNSLLLGFLAVFLGTALYGMFMPMCACGKGSSVLTAKVQLDVIKSALEAYHRDFNEYPPADAFGGNGSKILTHYLCAPVATESGIIGPYLASQHRELRSPFGGDYVYFLARKPDGSQDYLVVDPGKDQQLGGMFTLDHGFIPDGSGLDKDNLYCDGQMHDSK